MQYQNYIKDLADRSFKEPGAMGFSLHRITGVLITVYLFAHILVISTVLGGQTNFDAVLKQLQTPPFLFFDLGLLALVTYHSINGVRITLFDLGYATRQQKQLFWTVIGLTVIIVVAAFIVVLPKILSGGG